MMTACECKTFMSYPQPLGYTNFVLSDDVGGTLLRPPQMVGFLQKSDDLTPLGTLLDDVGGTLFRTPS